MANSKKSGVPQGTADPIEYLLDSGRTLAELAVEWGLKQTDAVYRLRRYEYAPRNRTAMRMAQTFGWTTGEVIDHWLDRSARAKKAAAR